MLAPLEFDPALHRYAIDGHQLWHVTDVLSAAGLVDYEHCTEEGKWLGSGIHRAIHIELTQGLDWTSIPETWHPYVGAARQYVDDHHAAIVEIERQVVSRIFGFAGTLDVILALHARCNPWCGVVRLASLTDWKSGAPVKATALQLAGYQHAYYEETRILIPHRVAVQLKPDGTYHPTEYTERTDRDRFLAALTVANLRREYGFLKGEATQ
jgi:hypothetical protein